MNVIAYFWLLPHNVWKIFNLNVSAFQSVLDFNRNSAKNFRQVLQFLFHFPSGANKKCAKDILLFIIYPVTKKGVCERYFSFQILNNSKELLSKLNTWRSKCVSFRKKFVGSKFLVLISIEVNAKGS